MPDRKELHFFPGQHAMIWAVDGKPSLRVEAWGGEDPVVGLTYNTMKPRKTTPGHYVIYSCQPYHTRTWDLSKIPWGTRLRLDMGTGEVMYETQLLSRPWRKVTDVIPLATTRALRQLYYALYGDTHKYDQDRDYIPDRWVFNDFGPWAVRYFVDKNHNRKLDAGEVLSGEMIHTTPQNEAQVAKGEPVTLEASHGCIHVSPIDRDRLHRVGAFQRGTALIIHSYGESVPAELR